MNRIVFSGDVEVQDELEVLFKQHGLEVKRPVKIEAANHREIETFLAVAGALSPITLCISSWFKSRRRACRLLVESDNRKVEIEAGSPEEIQKILEGAHKITIEPPNT